MRLSLAGSLALAASALLLPAPASAFPPDCERYGDKPCIVLCEWLDGWYENVERLLEDAPPKPFC
jgi:hypothetical protein